MPNLEITRATKEGRGPREAQSLQGHRRARGVLNKEQGQMPLLAERDRDSRSRVTSCFSGQDQTSFIRLTATAIKLFPCC